MRKIGFTRIYLFLYFTFSFIYNKHLIRVFNEFRNLYLIFAIKASLQSQFCQ